MPAPALQALVFDAYGTLFDVHSVAARCEALFPGQGQRLSQLWRGKQLEYTWLRSLMERHRDFRAVTEAGLAYAARALGLSLSAATRGELVDAYLRLDLFPEVKGALRALRPRRLAILSNGSPPMLEAAVRHAGLEEAFEAVLSVEEAGVYKPSPRVYQIATRRLDLPAAALGFVSANGWDAAGAAAFGFTTFWVNRAAAPPEELERPPDFTVSRLDEIPALLG